MENSSNLMSVHVSFKKKEITKEPYGEFHTYRMYFLQLSACRVRAWIWTVQPRGTLPLGELPPHSELEKVAILAIQDRGTLWESGEHFYQKTTNFFF